MNKKGQAIEQIGALVVPLIAIAIILTVGFLIMQESKEKILDLQGGDFCNATLYTLNRTAGGAYCCNSSACPDNPLVGNYTLNVSIGLCCNITSGGDPGSVHNCSDGETKAPYTKVDCTAGNTTGAKLSHAWNGTGETQNAMQDIPGWLPIIVITVIGAILIGLVAIFRRSR